MEKVTIIFAEDKERFRKAVIGELSRYHIHCIAEAGNGQELLKQLSKHTPDVVLLDLEMPKMDGNEAMNQIAEHYPGTRVIILSLHYDRLLVEDYLKRGAKGYVPKDEISGNIELLADGIREVRDGGLFVHDLPPRKSMHPAFKKPYTRKQKEIIPLLCEGSTNKEIASKMGIQVRSVEKHRQKIYKITNSVRATDFFKYAFSKGLQFLGKKDI